MKTRFLNTHVDREMEVLWESTTDGISCAGYTPNYIRVRTMAADPQTLGNQIRKASLVKVANDGEHIVAELRD